MKKVIIILISISILLFCTFTFFIMKRALTTTQRLPAMSQVKPFVLTDSTGKTFDSKELKGRVWVANFFFTTCSDICPIMSKNMASLSRTFEQVKNIKLVSISVNPESDTPSQLKEYQSKFYTGRDNWYFLTGDRSVIKDLAVNSFKMGDINEPVFHSSYFSLVDRNGYVRGYYDGTINEEVNKLFVDASHLLKER